MIKHEQIFSPVATSGLDLIESTTLQHIFNYIFPPRRDSALINDIWLGHLAARIKPTYAHAELAIIGSTVCQCKLHKMLLQVGHIINTHTYLIINYDLILIMTKYFSDSGVVHK
jgi:hypothetical protein